MSQTTTERVSRTAISVIARLQGQIEEGLQQIQQVAPEAQGMTFQHPQGMDKPDHYAVLQRQSSDTFKLVGVYSSDFPADAVQAAGGKPSDLIVVSTRSLWQPSS